MRPPGSTKTVVGMPNPPTARTKSPFESYPVGYVIPVVSAHARGSAVGLRDPQEAHPSPGRPVQLLEAGHLRDARGAPRGEEVDDEGTVVEVGVVDPITGLERGEREPLQDPSGSEVTGEGHAHRRRACDHPD